MTTFHGDPYRILGLLPGATETQVRSAYRRLVKKYHPDAAGDSTIGRFLAVQAAYDALMDPSSGHLRARPRTSARWAPWSADEDRVRATRRTDERTGGSTARDDRRRTSPGSAWDWGRQRGEAGADRGAGGPRPAGPASSAGPRPRAGTDGAGREGSAGGEQAAGGSAAGGRPRGKSRHRDHHVPKARPGSTTYDDAEWDPEPEWDGAGWYGPSMGTYWTINPKEYADPRKHGPEYQARAWRAAASANEPPADEPPANEPPANDPPANDRPANDPPANDPPAGTGEDRSGDVRSRPGPVPAAPGPGLLSRLLGGRRGRT